MSHEQPSFASLFPTLRVNRIKKLLASKHYKSLVGLVEVERRTSDRDAKAWLPELWPCVEAYVLQAGYSSKEYDAAYAIAVGNVARPLSER